MKDLRIKEWMTPEDMREFGADNPHRIEYAYGAINKDETETPIILRVADFWMPLTRAKKIHAWLGKAIAKCEAKNGRV